MILFVLSIHPGLAQDEPTPTQEMSATSYPVQVFDKYGNQVQNQVDQMNDTLIAKKRTEVTDGTTTIELPDGYELKIEELVDGFQINTENGTRIFYALYETAGGKLLEKETHYWQSETGDLIIDIFVFELDQENPTSRTERWGDTSTSSLSVNSNPSDPTTFSPVFSEPIVFDPTDAIEQIKGHIETVKLKVLNHPADESFGQQPRFKIGLNNNEANAPDTEADLLPKIAQTFQDFQVRSAGLSDDYTNIKGTLFSELTALLEVGFS